MRPERLTAILAAGVMASVGLVLVSVNGRALTGEVTNFLAFMGMGVVGALSLSRAPRNVIGLLMLWVAVSVGFAFAMGELSAYLYVREELRKVNLERRRSSMHGLVSPASAAAAGAAARVDGSPSPRTRDDTAVKLKRLSLPIVARASAIALASAGYAESAFADQQDARSSKPSSPPSAFRPPSSQWPQA